jgi:hypothetical protein
MEITAALLLNTKTTEPNFKEPSLLKCHYTIHNTTDKIAQHEKMKMFVYVTFVTVQEQQSRSIELYM